MKGGARSGITLVELLAAMALSAIVIVLASRIFLSGNREFLQRTLESERLARLYRMKAAVQAELRGEIVRCSGGKVWLLREGGEEEAGKRMQTRHPELKTAEFRCYEVDGVTHALVETAEDARPRLVEYRLVVEAKSKKDTLNGSWIK